MGIFKTKTYVQEKSLKKSRNDSGSKHASQEHVENRKHRRPATTNTIHGSRKATGSPGAIIMLFRRVRSLTSIIKAMIFGIENAPRDERSN